MSNFPEHGARYSSSSTAESFLRPPPTATRLDWDHSDQTIAPELYLGVTWLGHVVCCSPPLPHRCRSGLSGFSPLAPCRATPPYSNTHCIHLFLDILVSNSRALPLAQVMDNLLRTSFDVILVPLPHPVYPCGPRPCLPFF